MSEMVIGLIIGFGVGVVLLSGLMFTAIQRARQQSANRLVRQEETIADLRLELAEDKENNRLLRHQLHSLSSASGSSGLASPESGGELGNEAADATIRQITAERERAQQELSETRMTLESTRSRLEDREVKLNEYRDAVKEIRLSLEGQDSLRTAPSVAEDVPANAPAGE